MENPLRLRIEKRLAVTGKSRKEASLYIGMNHSYVSEFLNGKSDKIRFDLYTPLAEFLECDPRYLTGEIEEPIGPDEARVPIVLLQEIRDILKEAGQDLELEVLANHGGGEPTHPTAQRRFKRDVAPARRALQLSDQLASYVGPASEQSPEDAEEAGA